MRLLKPSWPVILIAITVLLFFYPVWTKGFVPLPADFVVGVYHPWLDYKWGYSVGVPVKNPMTTDVVSFIYPMQMLAIDLLKSGQWPLWNPYILAGTPLLANFQSAPFSPTNFVYFLFDKLTAWSIQVMLQHVLAAIFTYLLLRGWKVRKLPAALGGIVFAFAGFNTIWSQWNGHALSAAFIPLLLLFEDKWLVSGRLHWLVLFSVATAAQIFSGYPQVVFYTGIALILLWAFRFQKIEAPRAKSPRNLRPAPLSGAEIRRSEFSSLHPSRLAGWVLRRRTKSFFSKTALLAVSGLLGVGLAAPQILPGRELLALSQREVEPHPFEWAFLPWVKVITFFAPDYFGNHATGNYWGPQDYTSNTGFVGSIAFALAMLALPLLKKERVVVFSFVLLLVSLILSFPTPVSVFLWKSGILGFQAASQHRSLVLFNLGVALLAGFGLNRFIIEKKLEIVRSFLLPLLVIGGFATVSVVLLFLSHTQPDIYPATRHGIPMHEVGLRNLIFPIGVLVFGFLLFLWLKERSIRIRRPGLVLVFALVAVELFRFSWKFTPFSPRHIVFPTTPVLEYLITQEKPFRTTGSRVIPINMRMPYKIETLEGYDAVYPLHISQFIAAVTSGKSGTDPVGRYGTIGDETLRVLDLVNVKYNLAIKRDKKGRPSPEGKVPPALAADKLVGVFEDKSVAVLENKDVLPRAFMVYDWEVSGGTETLDKFMSANFPIGQKILVEEEPNITKSGSGSFSDVLYNKYTETGSKLWVNTSANGLLFVSDTWYPGWEAYVDGVKTGILRANFAFRAIPIAVGEHKVEFVYRPKSFFLGLKISGVSGLLLFVVSLFLRFVGKREARIYT